MPVPPPDYYGHSPLRGAVWCGRRILNVDYASRTAFLEDASRVPLDTIYDVLRNKGLWAPFKKPTLAERREERWEARMLRIKSKRWDKHLMFAAAVGYFMAWLWGALLLIVLTALLFKGAFWAVLG